MEVPWKFQHWLGNGDELCSSRSRLAEQPAGDTFNIVPIVIFSNISAASRIVPPSPPWFRLWGVSWLVGVISTLLYQEFINTAQALALFIF